jgi:hypothetical protein
MAHQRQQDFATNVVFVFLMWLKASTTAPVAAA